MKIATCEIKNTMDAFKCKLRLTEENVRKLEDTLVQSLKNETERKKNFCKTSFCGLCDKSEQPKTHVIGVD